MTDHAAISTYDVSRGRDGRSLFAAVYANFMGDAPSWYKQTVVALLAINPFLLASLGPVVTGWAIVAQFIFMLAMSLKCYPLLPGGLLAIEAVMIGLTDVGAVYNETVHGLPVILLITFMVAGVYFLRDMLFFMMARLLLAVRHRVVLSVLICFTIAILSAFLDALTILAVLVTVSASFYEVYHRVSSAHKLEPGQAEHHKVELEQFRAYLRGMLMHASVGTAIGGVATLVGEPENIIIGAAAGWDFGQFFIEVAPVSVPVFFAGLITCAVLEHFRAFGYGAELPRGVYEILRQHDAETSARMTIRDKANLVVQGAVCAVLIVALALHIAEVGLVGLAVIVLAATLTGINEEHKLGKAFEAGLPFASLLIVFFAIAAMIHDQHLFEPVITFVLGLEGYVRLLMVYLSNGALSAISDNVFVAAVYIGAVKDAFANGLIDREQFEDLSVAVVMGTGIPAMATPNGQAAFLFLFTSSIAGLIRLSYGRMVWMALPYVIVTSIVAALAVNLLV
ncbi:MAG: sodium/proton antiporter NhaB [Alphaproteobacteria bacterium]|nr:sodium/proton antiporter NhaB [Alphaproteobacteria bacterium]